MDVWYNPAMKRMYWTHPDTMEAEVEITVVGPCLVTTDPILFHPEEGGQPADKGTIGQAVVCDVRLVEGRVVHTLDRPLADGKHTARLDAEFRGHTAANHTAQHILSGIAEATFGLKTAAVHIGGGTCTVDFDKKVGWDVAEKLEREAMEVVTRDIPVETVFNDPEVQARSRFGPIDAETVRVVKIGEYDASACCGAHVAATGRIGLIRVFDRENRKQGTRVSFLAGRKALEQSQSETAVLRELRKTACCATAELAAAFQRSTDRTKELAKEVNRLWSLRLPDLAASAEVVTIQSSKVGIHVGELPRGLMARLAGTIAEAGAGAGIVVSGTQIAISSAGPDASGLLRQIQNRAGGKGGGSPKSANGTLGRTVTKSELMDILLQK